MIAELLKVGKENKRSKAELLAETGLTERQFVRQVHEERIHGAPILSSTNGGYWLARDAAEIWEFVNSMDHRAKSTFAASANARKMLEVYEGQLSLDLNSNTNEGGTPC